MLFSRISKFVALGTLAVTVSACNTSTSYTYQASPNVSVQSAGPKEQIGALTGAVVGGVVGKQLGKGSKNQGLATALGVFAGTLIGASAGESLDRMDRMHMAQANQQALEFGRTNETTSWKNPDSGNYGTITPTRTYTGASTVCREYTQTVYIGGVAKQGYGTACRQADGSWKITQ